MHSWAPTLACVARLARRRAEWRPTNIDDIQQLLTDAVKVELEADLKIGESQSNANGGIVCTAATVSSRAAARRACAQQ